MIDIERERALRKLSDFLEILSEVTSSPYSYVGANAQQVRKNWLGSRDMRCLKVPEEFLVQDFLTRGPCPQSGMIVYYRCDIDRALAWLVANGNITEEESSWIQVRWTLDLTEPA